MFWADLMWVVLLAIEYVSSNDYCNLTICGTQEHTMCKYPTSEPGPDCRNFDARKSKFSDSEKQMIVDAHNTYRNKIALGLETAGIGGGQLGASNMMELIWNDELAAIADRWAFQCKNAHDECRALLNGDTSGQNVAIGEFHTREADLVQYMETWFNEVDHYDGRWRRPFNQETDKTSGHFTQMVWGTTNRVGCGQSWFSVSTFEKVGHLLVCNYAPTGNTLGGTVYIRGPPCRACPGDKYTCSTRWSALCLNDAKSRSILRSEDGEMSNNSSGELVGGNLFQDTYKSVPGAEDDQRMGKSSHASRKFGAGLRLSALIVAVMLLVS